MKYVIIGAGPAGLSAAKTIRSICPLDEIVVISSDEAVYTRCLLHKYVENQRSEKSMNFTDPSFFDDNKIVWLKGKTVTAIDTETCQIQLDDGQTVFYDKLLLSTGADSVIPPVGQLRTASNVYGLRHLSDAKKIRQKAADSDKIVVIGAGLVGLDAASALLALGKTVTIVEMADQVLPQNLDTHAANAYQILFEQHGAAFKLGCKVAGTESDNAGCITSILLEDGEKLDCDFVVVAAGIKPSVTFLTESGVACERGVVTDSYLKTNDSNIYAAGDITGRAEIWPSAVQQGEVAAKNMCGVKTPIPDLFAQRNTINLFGLITIAIGDTSQKQNGTVYVREDRNSYRKIIMQKDGNVIGIILQGNIDYSGIWLQLVKEKINVAKTGKSVWKLSYADFFATDDKNICLSPKQ